MTRQATRSAPSTRVEARGRRRVARPGRLRKLPRARRRDVAVRLGDELPQRRRRARAGRRRAARRRSARARARTARPTGRERRSRRRSRVAAVGRRSAWRVPRRERDRAVDEVADAVGELVGPRGQQLVADVGVADRRHVASEPPAQRVAAGARDDVERVDRRPERLRDLLPLDREVVVHEDRRRQRLAGGAQDRRPVDRVKARDALADDVHALVAAAPPALVRVAARAVVQRGDVVRERVEPDVDHLARVAGHRDAPAVRALDRTRDAEVAQPAGDERQHLVAARARLDAQPPGLDRLAQRRLVARQAEEPVALAHRLGSDAVLRAAPVVQLVRGEERLAAAAVQPLVVALVEVAGVGAGVPQPLDAGPVARVGARADVVVVRDLQRPAERLEAVALARDELARPARRPPPPRGRSSARCRRCRSSSRTASPRARRWRASTSACTSSSAWPRCGSPLTYGIAVVRYVCRVLFIRCSLLAPWSEDQSPMNVHDPACEGPLSRGTS